MTRGDGMEGVLRKGRRQRRRAESETPDAATSPHAPERGGAAGMPLFLQSFQRDRGARLQAKLTVSQPGDMQELEAERVSAALDTSASTPSPTVPRQHRQGSSQPLDEPTRALMESHFGQDLGQVRVHHDASADHSARSINALAYTTGADIVFRAGHYAPESVEGRRLLAHELTHVVQQRSGRGAGAEGTSSAPPTGADVHVRRQHDGSAAQPATATQPATVAGQQNSQAAPTTPGQTQGTPVLWGLDLSVQPRRTYMSVRLPGYSLAEVATYLYGSPEAAAQLRATNGGLPDRLAPGTVLRPTEEPLTEAANASLNQALRGGYVLRSQGLPSSETGEQMMYTFTAAGQTFQLTGQQFESMRRSLGMWLVIRARIIKESAEYSLEHVYHSYLEETNSVVRGVSNWLGGTSVPSEGIWSRPRDMAQSIMDQLGGGGVPEANAISQNALLLARADRDLNEASRIWMRYINDTVEGAESAVSGLEVVRDTSFAIAAGIGGVVAAPLVFGTMTAAGLGTLGAGAVAVGGGAVTGGVIHGSLDFTAAVGQQVQMPGPMDWDYINRRTSHGFTSGLGEGAMGAGAYFMGAGLAARFGQQVSSTLLGRMTIGGITGSTMGFGTSTADVLMHPGAGPAGRRIFRGTLFGGLLGAGTAVIPINGLYRTGGTPMVPFTGEPVTPGWMYSSPWGMMQPGSNTSPVINAQPHEQLPPLPDGYTWARVNGGQWGIIRPPGAPDIEIHPYGPDAAERINFNLRLVDPGNPSRMIYTSSHSRAPGDTFPQSQRSSPGITTEDYTDPTTGITYRRGHGVPHADTIEPPPGGVNSTSDPHNFSPQARQYNDTFRRTLEVRFRAAGNNLREVSVYRPTPGRVNSGEAIPDVWWIIEVNPAGVPVNAWEIPATVTRNTSVNFDADIAPYARDVTLIPRGVLDAAGINVAPAAAGAGATGINESRRRR